MGACACKKESPVVAELPADMWDRVVEFLDLSSFADVRGATAVLCALPCHGGRRVEALRTYQRAHMLEPMTVGYVSRGFGYGEWQKVTLLRDSYVRLADGTVQWVRAGYLVTGGTVWAYPPHCLVSVQHSTPGE